MSNIKILHNPRCSKSRQTLQLLQEKGIEPEVMLYLTTPPSEVEINDILKMLQLEPRQLMRTKDELYKELNLADASLTPAQLVAAMHTNPKLIERPIVINQGQARIGRPPEQVLEIV
ncbi:MULTISPECIES: arsenate reductase (glutaredoxin) [unclassified Agarivorans]|uniref:arsenate reductase (glutaredoxin) n=1 Tax=unclassified Agarivorans TaxID=2636026 RepID=UPI0026E28CE2|nr:MULTISPECIES: arsenate reductase (glutaredoxin) [unclassified Agarivorans]MDO6687972.1 arsenate reductase (glutaredoxin) [Agarivorans sp. 3_MG-2023]MDO6717611.1 arsenate reductase (glutaredoxin) [Agarivorans sp. 2_MG-2023]